MVGNQFLWNLDACNTGAPKGSRHGQTKASRRSWIGLKQMDTINMKKLSLLKKIEGFARLSSGGFSL